MQIQPSEEGGTCTEDAGEDPDAVTGRGCEDDVGKLRHHVTVDRRPSLRVLPRDGGADVSERREHSDLAGTGWEGVTAASGTLGHAEPGGRRSRLICGGAASGVFRTRKALCEGSSQGTRVISGCGRFTQTHLCARSKPLPPVSLRSVCPSILQKPLSRQHSF